MPHFKLKTLERIFVQDIKSAALEDCELQNRKKTSTPKAFHWRFRTTTDPTRDETIQLRIPDFFTNSKSVDWGVDVKNSVCTY